LSNLFMNYELFFEPFPFISGSHRQTIISSMLVCHTSPPSETRYVILPDGDVVTYEISDVKDWRPTEPTVVLLHGLCGSHKSIYLVRMSKKLQKRKIRTIRINLRGCGSGKGLARKIYHSGQSEDIYMVLQDIKKITPYSPIILVGFSLGGNIVLKLAGELGKNAVGMVKGVIGINPPIDLLSSAELLRNTPHQVYERYFMRLLRSDLRYRQKIFPDMPKIVVPRNAHVIDYDNLYTAPTYGFSSAYEYYDTCSARRYLSQIDTPCKILFAKDDPIINPDSINNITLPSNVEVYITHKGGHVGYLAAPSSSHKFYWLDQLLLDWVDDLFLRGYS
ncbi:MAG: alpha/beta fold hydrolase, partial [Parachlamydiales bacterium]|nr:alpha/beta fold hydrolase [Parachlamydiales bacterium]